MDNCLSSKFALRGAFTFSLTHFLEGALVLSRSEKATISIAMDELSLYGRKLRFSIALLVGFLSRVSGVREPFLMWEITLFGSNQS